tara:strand:- start:8381 stop:9703 length:1323 start_codon:yes stop_codon:yes gene_type:complete
MKIYSVSELNTEARQALLLAFEYPISVKGEISDLRASRGHQYFKLRDSVTMHTVSCVLWKSSSASIDVSKYLHMEVIISAKVDFYAGFGQFQLNISEISEFGDGYLKKEIELLKKKLSNEGIFDHQKDLPKFPKVIGILTAHDSHALKDVCSKLNEKYPLAHLYVYPSLVQGAQAPRSLIKQLKRINKDSLVDVILIVRGGGSLQDLMAFNDEELVREIAKSKIPTITGIGHKPDVTLADYASDCNQETPTAAAIKAVPDSHTLREDIIHIESSILKAMKDIIDQIQIKLTNSNIIIKSRNPINVIKSLQRGFSDNETSLRRSINTKYRMQQKNINDEKIKIKRYLGYIHDKLNSQEKNKEYIMQMMNRSLTSKINTLIEILKLRIQQVKQISPSEVLRKGYAIIRDDNNKILKNIKSLTKNKEILIQMIDGELKVFRKK